MSVCVRTQKCIFKNPAEVTDVHCSNKQRVSKLITGLCVCLCEGEYVSLCKSEKLSFTCLCCFWYTVCMCVCVGWHALVHIDKYYTFSDEVTELPDTSPDVQTPGFTVCLLHFLSFFLSWLFWISLSTNTASLLYNLFYHNASVDHSLQLPLLAHIALNTYSTYTCTFVFTAVNMNMPPPRMEVLVLTLCKVTAPT